MLVITRKPGERIFIGDGDDMIVIMLVSLCSGRSAEFHVKQHGEPAQRLRLEVGEYNWISQSGPDRSDIKIELRNARRGQAMIGIDAPREIAIDREEIYHRKKRGSA